MILSPRSLIALSRTLARRPRQKCAITACRRARVEPYLTCQDHR